MSEMFDEVPDIWDYDDALSDPLRTLRDWLNS